MVRHECHRGVHGKLIGVLDDCCRGGFHGLFPFQSDLFPWRWLQWRMWLPCGQRRTRWFFVVSVVTYGLVNDAGWDVVSTAWWFWAVLWIFRNSLWQSAVSAWHLIILLQRYYIVQRITCYLCLVIWQRDEILCEKCYTIVLVCTLRSSSRTILLIKCVKIKTLCFYAFRVIIIVDVFSLCQNWHFIRYYLHNTASTYLYNMYFSQLHVQ